jgi:hypothetical protein
MFRLNDRMRRIDILMISRKAYLNNTLSNNLFSLYLEILGEASETTHHNGKNQDQLKLVY